MQSGVNRTGVRNTRREFLSLCALVTPAVMLFPARRLLAAQEPETPQVDLSFIERQTRLMRRWEWTKVAPRTSMLRDSGTFDRITIHHSGGANPAENSAKAIVRQLDGILAGHMEKRYGDIGYHFAIDSVGRIWEGRSLVYEGAHVSAQNERNVGIVLLGNFESQNPAVEQLRSMDLMVSLLSEHYSIKWNRIYGHRDLASSVCPGRNLYAFARKFRQ